MITMTIVAKVRPEKREEFLQAVHSLNNGRERPQGLRNFALYQEGDDHWDFSLIYEWEAKEDLKRYLGAEECRVLLGAVKTLCSEAEVKFGSVGREGGVANLKENEQSIMNIVRGKNSISKEKKEPHKKIIKEMTMKKILTATAFLALSFALIVSAQAQTCGTTTWNLTAGQYIDVGSVTVSNDKDYIYVTYALDYPGARFGNLQIWVGNDLANMPQNQNGTPIPGQFCQALGGYCFDATGLTTHTFTIPFVDISMVDANAACGSSLYVVTHAEVDMDGKPETTEHETAFGGDTPGSGPRWWFYGSYNICCDFGQPPQCFNETAYAKGGWVWTTDKKSNPDKLPSLNLTKNQWGWAINLTATGTTTYDIWAGAGLNMIYPANPKAVKVGTLTVNWDGNFAKITYNMFAGYYLEEVHIYARDARPASRAPGSYGYPTDGYEVGGLSSFSYTVPLADTNGTDGVWLIAHAVVSNGACQ